MQVSADIVSTFKIKSVSYSIKSVVAQNPVMRKGGAENYLVSIFSGQEGAVHLAKLLSKSEYLALVLGKA